MIWRGWVIWSRQWWVVVVPFTVSTTSCGNVSSLLASRFLPSLILALMTVVGIVGAAGADSNHPPLTSFIFIPIAALLVTSTGINTSLIIGRLL